MVTYGIDYIHKNPEDQVLILETLEETLEILEKRVSMVAIETEMFKSNE